MGTYEQLKAAITAAIKSNGNQEITGAILQGILLSIVNTIGSGAVFKGVATPTTNPGSRDENCFYLAGTAGTYSNFAGFALTEGLAVLQNSNGSWVGTKILSIASKADTDNIGGAHHLKYGQATMINLYNVEPISACTENNKLWFKTDGHLYYRQSGIDYDLGAPAYLLYYNGSKIYKWNGSGFIEMNSGSGEPVSLDFKTGESVEDISLFGSKASIDNKTDAQLALMVPTGAIIKALFDMIDSIDTSGGTYDGIDQVVTFSFSSSSRVITLKQSGRTAKTITLPLASTSAPGLMSAQDKTDLNEAKNKIVTGLSYAFNNGSTVITITYANNTSVSTTIPNSVVVSDVTQKGTNPVSGAAVYDFVIEGFNQLDADNFSYAPQTRILPLVSMGQDLDEGVVITKQANDFWYDPSTNHIVRENNSSQPWFLPQQKQLYLNLVTGKLYKWNGTSMVLVAGPGGSSVTIADNLTTDNGAVALSAAQGVLLKLNLDIIQANIRRLYAALGSIAFTNGKPSNEADIIHTLSWESAASVDITYNLTHLTTPTRPTSVELGGGETIVIAPESAHALPLAVRVTNATLESYNKTTGEIVISNATDDVVIEADAICRDFVFYYPGAVADYSGSYYNIAVFSGTQSNHRAIAVLPREGLVNPCTWGRTSAGVIAAAATANATYSTIPVPYGTTKIKVQLTNSLYSVSVGLMDTSGKNQKPNTWDVGQAEAREYLMADYPNTTHVAINFKNTDDSYWQARPDFENFGFDIIFE